MLTFMWQSHALNVEMQPLAIGASYPGNDSPVRAKLAMQIAWYAESW